VAQKGIVEAIAAVERVLKSITFNLRGRVAGQGNTGQEKKKRKIIQRSVKEKRAKKRKRDHEPWEYQLACGAPCDP